MNFRHIDQFDYELVLLNNAQPAGGSDYGDTFSDKALLATSGREQYGGNTDSQTLDLLEAAAGEAAGRSIFQKAAMYQGSKASRKILVSPSQEWASWSATPQPPRQSLQVVARRSEIEDARYFKQVIPPTIDLSIVDCGSDCVFSGSWQGHTDTRIPFDGLRQEETTVVTSGHVWLQVNPHFSSIVVRDNQTQEFRHDWRNSAIFNLTFVVFYKADPMVLSVSPFFSTLGQAGVLYGSFPITILPYQVLLPLPASGLYSPDAAVSSFNQYLDQWTALSYESTYSIPSGQSSPIQSAWGRVLSFFWYTGQSFYIASN